MGERLRLYHTGFHELRAPDITVGRKNADFGRGFYLSGSDAFPRIRLGVGAPPPPDYDMADWVLSVFRNQDLEDMRAAADRAGEAVISYITDGPERAMNRFN